MILQASEIDEGIRHAVIGSGALDNSEFAAKPEGLGLIPSIGCGNTETRRHYAMQQYGESLKAFQRYCKEGRQHMPNIHFACAITACFEIYNAAYEAAAIQIQIALDILTNYPYDSYCTARREQVDIFWRLQMQLVNFMDDPAPIYKKVAATETVLGEAPDRFESTAEARHWLGHFIREMLWRL